MKRIAFLLVCGMLLLVTSTAEARRNRRTNTVTYWPTTQTAPATFSAAPATYRSATPTATTTAETATTAVAAAETPASNAVAAQGTAVTAYRPVVTTASFDTRTAQGVANIMASYNRVGHWGGNPGYEGCGCGATPAAAYAICCYGNSGMATVDVGYAQSASGMWYCCRRYR